MKRIPLILCFHEILRILNIYALSIWTFRKFMILYHYNVSDLLYKTIF